MPRAEPGSTWDFSVDTTLIRVMARNAEVFPDRVAMREKNKGIWKETTWWELLDSVISCAAGLESLGFGAGEVMLVLGDNRPRLYAGMLAAGALNGYAMPAFADATLDEIRHFVHEAGARFMLAEDQEQVDKILDLRDQGATIEHIIYDDPRGLNTYPNPGLISWEAVQAKGAERLAANPTLRDALIQRAQPEGPAVFVHSSGSTGKPKGVVLSHRNLLAGVRNAHRGGAFQFDETILAYLPIAWVGDFAVTMAAGIALRFTINIPERQETVLHNLREIAPTFYLAAPRSWDNLLTAIQVRMEDSSRLKKFIYQFFMTAALSAERRKLDGGEPTLKERLLSPLGEWLVCGPIKDQFGLARLRGAFTGGEAMGEDTFVFYRALGIKLRQLYGQTESSAYNAIQSMDEVRLHTVGRPLPGVEVQISPTGEILIRSGSVFAGYFKQDEATRETLDGDWLHTGDAGYLEPDGHLVVLGRLSDVVHTAKGERYIPNYIENRLEIQSIYQGCRRARTRPRDAFGHHLHRQGSRRPVGRVARHLVHFLCRPVAKARSDRTGCRRRQARQSLAAGRIAGAALRLPAQGIRRRRWRNHPHPQDPAQCRGSPLSTDHRRHLRQPADRADESSNQLRNR